jgi:hypothetical protein
LLYKDFARPEPPIFPLTCDFVSPAAPRRGRRHNTRRSCCLWCAYFGPGLVSWSAVVLKKGRREYWRYLIVLTHCAHILHCLSYSLALFCSFLCFAHSFTIAPLQEQRPLLAPGSPHTCAPALLRTGFSLTHTPYSLTHTPPLSYTHTRGKNTTYSPARQVPCRAGISPCYAAAAERGSSEAAHAAGEAGFANPGARNVSGHAKTERKKKAASSAQASTKLFEAITARGALLSANL